MKERRKDTDRRAYIKKQDKAYSCSRRYRPCRRLNNISVKWYPFDESTTLISEPV